MLWGGALVAGRVITVSMSPFTITFLRFIAVSLFLFPSLYIKNGSLPVPSRRELALLAALGITGILLYNVFLFSGLRTVTAIRSSVIIAFTPSVVALVSGLFFREEITRRMWLGIFFAFVGAVITITEGQLGLIFKNPFSIGDLFLLGCVGTWTVYSLIAKHAMRDLDPLTVLTYGSFLGAILLIPFVLRDGSIWQLASQPPAAWISLAYLSIGAAGIAYLFYYQGIKAVGASRSAIFLNLEPVAAIALGMLILDEKLTLPISIGAVLVIGGLFLTTYQPKKDRGNKVVTAAKAAKK